MPGCRKKGRSDRPPNPAQNHAGAVLLGGGKKERQLLASPILPHQSPARPQEGYYGSRRGDCHNSLLGAAPGFDAVELGLQVAVFLFYRRPGALHQRGFEQDLAAGQIDLFYDTPASLPLMSAGSIKGYAVSRQTRLAIAPDIPTFAEMGLPGLFWSEWSGFFAPRATPKDVISKINTAVVEALADPAVRSRFDDLGMEIFPRERQTPEALGALQRDDAAKWWPLIKEFGIKAE